MDKTTFKIMESIYDLDEKREQLAKEKELILKGPGSAIGLERVQIEIFKCDIIINWLGHKMTDGR